MQSLKINSAKINRTSRRNRLTAIIFKDFNIFLTIIGRKSGQKISKDRD